MTPPPRILERFLEPKSIQDRKKGHSKTLQKSTRNLIRFLTTILDPMGTPKIKHFSLIFTLGATLGPSWRQEAPKVLQDGSRARFSKKFVPFWNQFSMDFVGFRSLFFYTIPHLISNSMFYFWWHFNRAASICNSVFPAAGSARWRLGARSALDTRKTHASCATKTYGKHTL